jgi:hypothetical protein
LARSIFDRDDDILIILLGGEFSNGSLSLPSVRPKDGQSTQSNEKVAKIVANLNSVETSALKLNLKIANASIKSLLKTQNSYNKPCLEIDYSHKNVKI